MKHVLMWKGLIKEAVEGTVIEEITANYTTPVETTSQEN